jgi:hypothetical protein
VGVLEAVTQKETGQLVDANGVRRQSVVEPLANYFAGRLRRDLRGGRTTFGGMLTAVCYRLQLDVGKRAGSWIWNTAPAGSAHSTPSATDAKSGASTSVTTLATSSRCGRRTCWCSR